MRFHFRQATQDDAEAIWQILFQAIQRRKTDGSSQWQDGYPNPDVVKRDIEQHVAYVLTHDDTVVAYSAMFINDEPAYAAIEGKWLSEGDFVVVHRIAVAQEYIGQGLAKQILFCIEELARNKEIYSIKCDTNFDNIAMMKTFDSLGYRYCGEVYFRGSARRAYEKLLGTTE